LKFNCKLVNEKVDGEISRARYKKELLKSCWSKVVNVFDLQKYATSKLREQINSFVEQQSSVPFTMTNIYRMANMIIQTNDQRMESVICDAFDLICSFAPENCDLDKRGKANNVDAWKTNSDYMVNRRFIVPNVI
jgi:translation initiation factor 2B subunit (eIF-2B alpha/beta/delta family)